jgi:hypothetical protein
LHNLPEAVLRATEILRNVAQLMERRMKLRFGEVEHALQGMHDVASVKASGFRARLRHLKRAGLRTGASAPGRKANLAIGDAVMIALAVELGQIGNTPERSAEILHANLDQVRSAVATANAAEQSASPIILYFFPESWADLSNGNVEGEADKAASTFGWTNAVDLAARLPGFFDAGSSRIAMINLSDVLLHLVTALAPPERRAALRDEIAAWTGMEPLTWQQ